MEEEVRDRILIPRVTTRGYYSVEDGRRLKSGYSVYPPHTMKKIRGAEEVVIMVHGLRNDRAGASAKFEIASERLRDLGYAHQVIGYSYDSNVKGAHIRANQAAALRTGCIIARKNGRNLSKFILDLAEYSPDTGVRLIGHSLGAQVIMSTIGHTAQSGIPIRSIHLFGASIPRRLFISRYVPLVQRAVSKQLVNYYAPSDEVLADANRTRLIRDPIGLDGFDSMPKCTSVKVSPENHRFASYAAVLDSFP